MNETQIYKFFTGQAGTGKTYNARLEATNSKSSKPMILAATTGIAAINLGTKVTTINSLLGFYDTDSLENSYNRGFLEYTLKDIASNYSHIVIDECSMMEARQVDLIVKALERVNQDKEEDEKLKLTLVGDFLQLPPVSGEFAFKAENWSKFHENTVKLTKVYRQSNPDFLAALNAARVGDGDTAVEALESAKVNFVQQASKIPPDLQATNVFAKNADVDTFNATILRRLIESGKKRIDFEKKTWGKQASDWKIIPQKLELAQTALVMILANAYKKKKAGEEGEKELLYANGQLGILEDVTSPVIDIDERMLILDGTDRLVGEAPKENPLSRKAKVRLLSNNSVVFVSYVTRQNLVSKIKGVENPEIPPKEQGETKKEYLERLNGLTVLGASKRPVGSFDPYFDYVKGKWVIGEVTYMPLRLANASTVHKMQGLTVDQLVINPQSEMFSKPAMIYVALSRVRSPEGLWIVCNKRSLANKINAEYEAVQFA